MTRQELLRILIRQARANDFAFRSWYQSAVDPVWHNFEDAIEVLSQGRKYYVLLFAHEFAQAFWNHGSQISFVVPGSTYTRTDKQGRIVTVNRKPFTRRTLKANVWKYHLREMAAENQPLRYIRRFLVIEGDIERPKSVAS